MLAFECEIFHSLYFHSYFKTYSFGYIGKKVAPKANVCLSVKGAADSRSREYPPDWRFPSFFSRVLD